MRNFALFILALIAAVFVLSSCKDLPPQTIIVPPTETPRNTIDNFYYVKFAWGTRGDTVVMEVPDLITYADSTINYDSLDPKLDYFMEVFDLKDELIYDTTNAAELEWLGLKPAKLHWHYAPTVALFNYTTRNFIDEEDSDPALPYWDFIEDPYKLDLRTKIVNLGHDFGYDAPEEGEETDPEAEAYKDMFFMSFPFIHKNDTVGYWDIADYLNDSPVHEGNVRWGRVGNGIPKDTMWNNDAYDGVVIHYRDKQGVVWESDNDPTFQDGSYFEITKKTHRHSAGGDGKSYFVIEGYFSAILYSKSTESIRAAEGEFRLNILDDVPLSPQPK